MPYFGDESALRFPRRTERTVGESLSARVT